MLRRELMSLASIQLEAHDKRSSETYSMHIVQLKENWHFFVQYNSFLQNGFITLHRKRNYTFQYNNKSYKPKLCMIRLGDNIINVRAYIKAEICTLIRTKNMEAFIGAKHCKRFFNWGSCLIP